MRLAVTGVGLITSVGWSAASACAAIRAGVVRARPLPYFKVLDSETQDAVPVIGHPVHGFTEGFAMVGRWLRLAGGALADFLGTQPHASDSAYWQRTGLLAVLPRIDDDRFHNEGANVEASVREAYIEPLVARMDRALASRAVGTGGFGPTGMASAMQRAAGILRAREADRVLILAVDSLLDALSLQWLQRHRRLKTPDFAVGLMPGEAAGCLLVEEAGSAERSGRSIQVEIRAAEVGREPSVAPAPSSGRGLDTVVRKALATARVEGPFSGDLMSDHNGEAWRAHEMGMVQHRLIDVLAHPCWRFPCTSIGDVGASSGAVGVCFAAHLFWRRAETGPVALVLSSSREGDVSCIAVARRGA